MLRHRGVRRTFRHNLSLAILLSYTAGFVNVSGFFAITVLTTNVTGHIANIAWLLVNANYSLASLVALWVMLFFMGAFISNFLITWISRRDAGYANAIPIFLEATILIFICLFGDQIENHEIKVKVIAGLLMFAMGMQNAIVSVVSGSVVRTSHLTGMFTDLGIELSQLFWTPKSEKIILFRKIILHSTIVLFFFLGGITGGGFFQKFGYNTFIVPICLLLFALFYDVTRINIYLGLKRIRSMYQKRFFKE